MTVGLDAGELVGTLLESVLFGFSLVFAGKTYNFFRRSRRKFEGTVNPLFVWALWTLVFWSIVHLVVDWHRMIIAFIQIQSLGDRISFLNDFDYSRANIQNSWTYLIKFVAFVLQTWIGDAIMAYRCYCVWLPQRWLGILPAVISLITLIGGFGSIGISVKSSSLFLGRLSQFITCFWVATVTTNIVSTGLILLKLWMSNRARGMMYATWTIRPIVIVLLESGLLYSGVCIFAFILFERSSFLLVVVLNFLPPYTLFLFSFVLLRIVDNRNQETTLLSKNGHTQTFGSRGFDRSGGRRPHEQFLRSKSGSRDESDEVRITRIEHIEMDSSSTNELRDDKAVRTGSSTLV